MQPENLEGGEDVDSSSQAFCAIRIVRTQQAPRGAAGSLKVLLDWQHRQHGGWVEEGVRRSKHLLHCVQIVQDHLAVLREAG